MFEDLSLFPRAASTVADDVDRIYLFLVAMTAFAVTVIASVIVFFAIRYRRRIGHRAEQVEGSMPLEVFWSAVPLLLWLFVFGWSAKVYLGIHRTPKDGMQITVTGKQWMWKIQHPTGQREINRLHVPVNTPIILTLISEDVIHDFYVPAFRIKRDVVPGMYTRVWFEATRVGTYHLFCAEYCGTKHSEMIGQVVVMEPSEYEQWLSGQPAASPVEAGEVLFDTLRCVTCHDAGSGQRGPDLAGLFGTEVDVEGGRKVLFDEEYVRESILEPKAEITAGYQPLMPTYQGQVTETQIQHLIAYVRSLAASTPGDSQE